LVIIRPGRKILIDLDMGQAATRLSRNPLGIIALFIVMVYGFACLVLGLACTEFDATDRHVMVAFLALFPMFVLCVFTWLVSTRPTALYAPRDFQSDAGFIDTLRAGTHIAAAEVTQSVQGGQSRVEADRIALLVAEAFAAFDNRRGQHRLLWVDDHPDNNRYERLAFEDYGFAITLATSTDEAMTAVQRQPFDVIVSDMNRREGPNEGWVLLERLRDTGNRAPFVIYSATGREADTVEARRRGADGYVSNPATLFRLVTDAVARRSAQRHFAAATE
jgi:CheY-like chemotaxis protein